MAKNKSKRQIAFEALDAMAGVPRNEAAQQLVEHLGVSLSYAKTLFQSHRQDRSSNIEADTGNGFVTVYKVRDTRSNKAVDPYMSSMVKNNPDTNAPRTTTKAIEQYLVDNTRKSELAKKLS